MSTLGKINTMYAKSCLQNCTCRDCGMPLDVQRQADGNGGSYIIVTCWNPQCLLRAMTRSLNTYSKLTDSELEAYRDMNRSQQAAAV